MVKHFETTQGHTTMHHIVSECTAVAASIGDTKRQNALFVRSCEDFDGGEEVAEFVVFGWEMPTDDDEFLAMCGEPSAWDSDWETIETIRF